MVDLKELYYRPPHPAAYAGVKNLARSVRIPRSKVIEWLETQDAYNSHRLVRKRFPRRFYNTQNIDDTWELDLADLRSIKSYNDDVSYLLVVVDILSKFAWVEPLTDKTGKSVADGFERVLKRSGGRVPVCVQSDAGKEFVSGKFQSILKKFDVTFKPAPSSDSKAACAERFIRTIKERIWRYFTHKRTRRYIDVLQNIVESYNNTRHSATKMIPSTVTLENAAIARANLENKYSCKSQRAPKYNVGDMVRISRAKNVFEKGYESGWTLELFKIVRVSSARYPVVYYLQDLSGEDIEGFFYEQELSRVRKDLEEATFEVEKILKVVGNGPTKKFLVKWKGYPDKFNQWINASDVEDST